MNKIKIFIISFILLLIPIVTYADVELVSITTNNTNEGIISKEEYGYNFSVIFSDKDQEIEYKAKIKNTYKKDIKIKEVIVNSPNNDAIEYKVTGIKKNEIIKKNKEKEITIKIKTKKELEGPSIDNNFLLTINYDNEEDIVNPKTGNNTTTIMIISLIVFSCLMIFLFKNNKLNIIKPMCILLGLILLTSIETVYSKTNNFIINGRVQYKQKYTLKINPNEGKFNNSNELFSITVPDGEKINISNIEREYYSFKGYKDENNNLIKDDEITIDKNITLTAEWERIKYTLKIDPNKGIYDSSESVQTIEVDAGTYYELLPATRERYDFVSWEINPQGVIVDSENKIFVDKDISLKALWNERYVILTIDPSGGTYNNYAGIYTSSYFIDDAEEVTLLTPVYPGKRFIGWKLEDDTEYNATTVIMTQSIKLIAVYEDIYYNVEINPNDGEFNNSSEIYRTQVTYNTKIDLSSIKREGYIFKGFKNQNNQILNINEIEIKEDTTLTAQWVEAIARIGEVDYDSITSAESSAVSGDTIVLLKNTNEEFTNRKTVTLDLNGKTLTGSLTNTTSGDITLINGYINNPNGTAVINKGVLTMGINDLDENGISNIEENSLGIIGKEIAMEQKGTLNYYDGYLEADTALIGGSDDSPYHRNAWDGETVYYYPVVDFDTQNNTQRVVLGSIDLAVSKTSVNGDLYYYNLQDNINTSSVSGYTIYAVRDFPAQYPITVKEDTTIVFDLDGYSPTFTNTLTNNGTLTITDRSEEKGLLNTSKTITNNGVLNIKNATISGTTDEPLMNNKNTLNMVSGTLAQTTGYTYNSIFEGAILNMDENSYIKSTSTNKAALYNNVDFEFNKGNIIGSYRAIHMHGGSLTVNGGTIKSESNTTGNVAIYVDNGINVIINNGNIISKTNSPEGNPNGNSGRETTVIYLSSNNNNITVNGGNLTSGGSSLGGVRRIIYGVSASLGNTITINDGELNATHEIINEIANASYPTTYFIQGYTLGSAANTTYVKGGKINIFSKNVAYGFGNVTSGDNNANIISGGEITITAGTGYGIVNGRNTISGGTIRINAENKGYGINGGTNTINNGQIIIQSENGTGYGINGGTNNISGGRIESSTYGIYNGTTTLGNNDGEINIENPEIIGDSYGVYGGTMNFYDGILKGKTLAYQDGIIKTIPDGTIYHKEVIIDYENCWLKNGQEYLEVNGTRYSSMTAAYEDVEDGGTIYVVDSIVSEAALPEFKKNKNITLDLNGNSITYLQPLINTNGSLTIIDSKGNGSLNNTNASNPTIRNNGGSLIIDSGIINGIYRAIHMHGGSLTVNGGTIKSESNTTGNVAIYVDNGINVIINNGNIISKTNSPEGNPNGNSGRETTVIYLSSNNNNITVNGGNLTSGGSSLGGVRRIIYGVSASLGNTITINDGELNATHEIINEIANASYPTTYFIQGYTLGSAANTTYVKGGKINIFSKNVAYGFGNVTSGDNNANIISGGEITITAGTGYGIANGRNTISGGTIRINAENKGYGINGGTNTINNGQIIIQSENGTGYGINGGTNTINNGQIIIQSENGIGYGINSGTNNILGGRIEGLTYGIYNGTTTLGSNDGEINIENPEIIGDSYGVYGGTINFYDGVLKGQTAAYLDKSIYNIATASKINEEVKEINGENYYVDYLVPQTGVIQINGDVNKEYNDLNSAILNSEPGDKLVLIDNILNTDPITIPSEKEITIDVSNYSIDSSKPIINNGNVSIINDSNEERIIKYYGSDYLITNNNGATLILSNIDLEAQYVIKNNASGIFNGNNVNITSTNTAINNLGKINIDNSDITGTTYGIYSSSNEENSITNSIINSTSNSIYNNSTSTTICDNLVINGLVTNNNVNGTLNFKDSEIINSLTSAQEIINKGNMTLDNTNVNGSYNKAIQNDGILSINNGSIISVESETSRPENATGINNSKSLSINNSTINVNIPNSSNIFTYTLYGIYNTKDVTMDNTSITVDSNDKFNHYGMYTETGNVLMSSGSIKVKGLTSYGIYLKSGSVTLGVPEVYGSSTYGRENADVSITSPLIESLGTTNGIGIKNDSQGLTYYDGKIVARNKPLPEDPNTVEYMYEPKEYTDEDTGYKYVILKWLRTQGGN